MKALAAAILALKHVDRAGWLRVGIAQPESVAAHSFGVATLGLILCPPELDRSRVVAIALLHDLAESVVGDITPHDGVSVDEKRRQERTAAAQLFAGRPDLWALWEDYEQDRSPEAHFVHELDKLDMALQAGAYASEADTAQFVESALKKLRSPALLSLL